MSVKTERIGNNILKELSEILRLEARNKDLNEVTLTYVHVTTDLMYAKIYYNIFDLKKKDAIQKSLEKAEGYLKSELAHRIDIRHIPELHFIYDESIEYGNKIENILKDINNK